MTETETVYVYRDNGPASSLARAWRAQRIVRDTILDDELLPVPVHATTDDAICAALLLWPHATFERAGLRPPRWARSEKTP